MRTSVPKLPRRRGPGAWEVLTGIATWQAGKVGVFTASAYGVAASLSCAFLGGDPPAYAGPLLQASAAGTLLGGVIGLSEGVWWLSDRAVPRDRLPALAEARDALLTLGLEGTNAVLGTIRNKTLFLGAASAGAVALRDGISRGDITSAAMGGAAVASAAVLSAAWRLQRPTTRLPESGEAGSREAE